MGAEGRPTDEEKQDGASPDAPAAEEDPGWRRWVPAAPAKFVTKLQHSARQFGQPDPSVQDSMTYNAEILTDWRVFFALGLKATITHGAVLPMMWRLMVLSVVIALLSLVIMPDPDRLKSSRFKEIGKFLQVFVGLMLGFFLSSSVTRWYQCVDGFLHLFDTVRTLQMQFFALGVNDETRHRVLRYGFISAWLLSQDLRVRTLPDEEQEARKARMWEDLVTTPEGETLCHADRSEVDLLMKVVDPATCIWVWVASLLGHMAHQGDVPAMATPTWGRLMEFVEGAHNAIRSVKASISVRAPFLYVQMLSLLVHANSLVNAVSLGLTLGTTLGSLVTRYRSLRLGMGYNGKASSTDLLLDFENLGVTMFVNFLGPMLYLALFEVCVAMTEPFKHQGANTAAYSLNIDKLLAQLELDLRNGAHLARSTPSWDPPSFAKKEVSREAADHKGLQA